jgi:prepilin-type processing-associated H-X9-DG protein
MESPCGGPTLIPNDPTNVNGSGPQFGNYAATFQFGAGPNGAVSASHNNMANFCFTDGHSKAMIPTNTNPNPNTQPQNNMWNATR